MTISPRRILMVHGDGEERGRLALILTRFGHCVSFSDGMLTPELSADGYDLIIVDEHLARDPEFGYLQLLPREYRARTIVLSSDGFAERRIRRDSMGFFECIEKPVVPIDLAVVVCDYFISCFSNEESMAATGA